jgi:ADP-dependent NAD(P)H-hydrate dehydratase
MKDEGDPFHPSSFIPHPSVITPDLLRSWPLPQPDEEGDKEERGRVLVVGGSPEMPGAVLLAAVAALRAGAGKLRIATGQGIAQLVAAAVPEARVFSLPETGAGAIHESAADSLVEYGQSVQAVVVGPGMVDEAAVTRLLRGVLPRLEDPVVILDAAALAVAGEDPESLRPLRDRLILTPHAGEMAGLLGVDKSSVARAWRGMARRAAVRFGAVVALKGAETVIAAPGGEMYCNRAGNVGLATSGSGDTLAGIVAGLAARGANPLQATAWGVYLHAAAGDRLAARMGRLGFLARELLAEIPALMAELDDPEEV